MFSTRGKDSKPCPFGFRNDKELSLVHMAKILNLVHLKESKNPLRECQEISYSVYEEG